METDHRNYEEGRLRWKYAEHWFSELISLGLCFEAYQTTHYHTGPGADEKGMRIIGIAFSDTGEFTGNLCVEPAIRSGLYHISDVIEAFVVGYRYTKGLNQNGRPRVTAVQE